MRLKGKRALVTAAGQGIGRAIRDSFVREGAEVIALDRDASLLDGLPGAIVLDLADRSATASLPDRVGTFDTVINAAGIVHAGSILDCPHDEWDQAFDLNVSAMYRVIKACLPGMLDRGGGSIVNIASVASSIIGVPNRFAYGASKGAVIGLTKAVAADFVARGVRCNAICPGTVETPSLLQRVREQAERDGRDFDQSYQAFAGRQPVGRLGRADEIAAVALHLASDESAFITGTTAVIDGGWTLL